eukprot:1073856-Rhodomonas_salina.1
MYCRTLSRYAYLGEIMAPRAQASVYSAQDHTAHSTRYHLTLIAVPRIRWLSTGHRIARAQPAPYALSVPGIAQHARRQIRVPDSMLYCRHTRSELVTPYPTSVPRFA